MARKKSKKLPVHKEHVAIIAVITVLIVGGIFAYQGFLKSPDGHDHTKEYPVNPQIAGETAEPSVSSDGDPVPAESISTMLTIPTQIKSDELSVLSFDLRMENEFGQIPITGLVKHFDYYLHVSVFDGNALIDTVYPSEFKEINPNSNIYSVEFTFPESGEYRIVLDYKTSEFIFNDEFELNVE